MKENIFEKTINSYQLVGNNKIEAYGYKIPYEKIAEDSKDLTGMFKVAGKSFGFVWNKATQKLKDLFKKPKIDPDKDYPDPYAYPNKSHTHTHTHNTF